MAIVTNDWTARITGSAYTDNTNNKITAPHGKYIIAIQATGNAGSANNALPYGTKVKAVNVGGDPKEITLDTNVTLSDEQTIYFTDPNDTVHGTGGMNAGTGTNLRVVVGGGYYMGRWLSVQPVTDDGNGVICYFGE